MMQTSRSNVKTPGNSSSHHESKKEILAEATPRANNKATPPRKAVAQKPPSSPLIPHHHQSRKASDLHVNEAGDVPEDRRISALTERGQIESSVSTSAPNGRRKLKTHVGPWHLGPTLGTGATGKVRKARHTGTGQLAAVKVVSRRNATDLRSHSVMQMDRKRAKTPLQIHRRVLPFGIEREIVIMKIIEHPNVIKLYDVWENCGELYLVLEYVETGELFDYIVQSKYLEEDEAVRIFRQIISAVGYCHEFHLCHRDIKPENILLDAMGNVKLVDFGMASREHSDGLVTSCGSPHYAPPEIALGQKYRGFQADVWSCGVVLYVMLCGTLPFGMSYTIPEEVQLILHDVITREVEFPCEISDVAVDLMKRLLHKAPSNRPAIKDIWAHDLLRKYEGYEKEPDKAATWIGGPPPELTHADCGERIKSHEDIDSDTLQGLCTLWHSHEKEKMVVALLSDTPNYEKIIYKNLLKFKVEQEENYDGGNIEIPTSDYHHTSKRPIRRTVTRSSLLSAGQKRSSSQFSIGEASKSRNASTKSRGALSEPETKQSYDPFRPSRHQLMPAEADHAKITLLNGSSTHSKDVPSLRHPAVVRLRQEYSSSIPSSPQLCARDGDGRIRDLRRRSFRSISRQDTSSSWASTRSSGAGSMRKSLSYKSKRRVIFDRHGRNSSHQRTPPPRPQNPTPLTLQQRYIQDAESGDQKHFASPPPEKMSSDNTTTPPPVRSKKEAADVRRKSQQWEERTRQVSAELSNLCDEVFKSKTDSSSLFDREVGVEKLRTFARKSLDLPFFQFHIVEDPPGEARRSRPLPEPPLHESEALEAYRELAQTKERLKKYAKELGSDELNGTISQIDRLMALNASRIVEQQEHKRIKSAPEPRTYDFQYLSPVKEVDEHNGYGTSSGSRRVSEPTKGGREEQDFRNFNTWEYPSTIRPIDDADLRPRPLTIKKKISEPAIKSASEQEEPQIEAHNLKTKMKAGNASTSALDKLFGHSTKLAHSRNKTGEISARTPLQSIGEHREKENNGLEDSKRASAESKGKKWFRKSASSTKSSIEVLAPDATLSEQHSDNLQCTGKQTSTRSGGTSDGTSDEIPIRQAHKEKMSTARKLLRFFSKRDKRMHIVNSNEENDSMYDDQSLDDSQISAYASGALAMSSNLKEHAKQARFGKPPQPTNGTNSSNRLDGEAYNWFARFLHVKPAKRVLALGASRDLAIREIYSIFKDWRRYGMHEVTLDKKRNRIIAAVDDDNTLQVKPVTLMCEVFSILVNNRAQGMAVVKFNQQKGAKSSFDRAVSAMKNVLKGRGLIVTQKSKAREMRHCLADWEAEKT